MSNLIYLTIRNSIVIALLVVALIVHCAATYDKPFIAAFMFALYYFICVYNEVIGVTVMELRIKEKLVEQSNRTRVLIYLVLIYGAGIGGWSINMVPPNSWFSVITILYIMLVTVWYLDRKNTTIYRMQMGLH